MYVRFLFILVFILLSNSLIAQITLLGHVMNFDEVPVAEALVYLDGKKTDSITNHRGYFQVEVPEGTKVITIISKKYGSLSTPFNGDDKMNFIYLNSELSKKNEDDEVEIGYGSVKRENTTHSSKEVVIDKKDQTRNFTSVYDLIRGRFPGVRVTDENRIYIRGRSSINSSNEPLFVVDGTIVPSISHVLPTEVKNIEVLKDAAASIYGTRAANGVILITLKD